MSFVKRETPPPDVKEGEVVEAKILDIEFPVESGFKTKEGKLQYQVKFTVELDNGYSTPSWIRYYKRPSERSNLGALCLTLIKTTGKEYADVSKTLKALKDYGRIFVQVPIKDGFREWNGKLYPKFKIVPFKLPSVGTAAPTPVSPAKEAIQTAKPVIEGLSQETSDFIQKSKNLIEMGLPMNETDWNMISAVTRGELLQHKLVEAKTDAENKKNLYYFTKATAPFFREE